jgi:hypothetical protein
MSIFDDLPGTRLTPGTITIPAAEAAQLAEVLGSDPPDDGRLHPLYAYIAAQRGIGVSVSELCALAEFDVNDGPLLGSLELEIQDRLRPETEYRVEGEIVSIVRKEGRTIGTFDLLTFVERIVDQSGRLMSTATVTFVLPRKGAA